MIMQTFKKLKELDHNAQKFEIFYSYLEKIETGISYAEKGFVKEANCLDILKKSILQDIAYYKNERTVYIDRLEDLLNPHFKKEEE